MSPLTAHAKANTGRKGRREGNKALSSRSSGHEEQNPVRTRVRATFLLARKGRGFFQGLSAERHTSPFPTACNVLGLTASTGSETRTPRGPRAMTADLPSPPSPCRDLGTAKSWLFFSHGCLAHTSPYWDLKAVAVAGTSSWPQRRWLRQGDGAGGQGAAPLPTPAGFGSAGKSGPFD